MDYVLAKLYAPKKGEWYIYFSAKNPETGEMVRVKVREGINRLKTVKEKKHAASVKITGINNDLKNGWTPFNAEPERDKNRLNFYWWFEEKLAHEKARGDEAYGYHKALDKVYRKMKKFKSSIKVSELDLKLIKDFETYLIKEEASNNYIADIMKRIRGITTMIVNSGEMQYHKNPFLKYKPKKDPIKSKRLTLDEVLKLKNVALESEAMELARDMYVFSFYMAGMRFSDICRIKKSFFESDYAYYTMNKVKNDRRIKIMPEVAEIFKKYNQTEGEYLFPLKIRWEEGKKQIEAKNAYYNKMLKNACGIAEIPKVSYHTARHSVADLAHKSNIGIRGISDLLGHSNTATTERYMKRFYQEETDSAMDTIFKKNDTNK